MVHQENKNADEHKQATGRLIVGLCGNMHKVKYASVETATARRPCIQWMFPAATRRPYGNRHM